MAHWFDLMNDEGWIPRENILGSEARVRLPDEFVVQRNNQGNQPTFFLVLDANMFKTSLLDSRAFLERISEPAQQTKPSSSYHIRNFFVKIDLAVRGEKLLKLWRRRRFLILKRQKKKKNVRPCWLRLVRNSLSILNGPAADRRVWNR